MPRYYRVSFVINTIASVKVFTIYIENISSQQERILTVEFLAFIKYSTPVLVLAMLIYLERIRVTLDTIREDVTSLKKGVTWSDTCDARHEEINRRFAARAAL